MVNLPLIIYTLLVGPELTTGKPGAKNVIDYILQRLNLALDLAKQQGGNQVVEDDKPIL